jgi:predicted ArsR family transcriptional regulator
MARRKRAVRLTDPRALRAVAHPTRLSLVGLLRREGPLTASQAAERLGETPQRCTYHLNQLAKHGLVEEAGGGRGRERPWQATASATVVPSATTPEGAVAVQLFETVVAERYFDELFQWIDRRPSEPAEWQDAAQFGDQILRLTADELADLGRQVDALLAPYYGRKKDPEGSRPVWWLRLAFPER